MINHVLTVDIIGVVWKKGGRIEKQWLLKQALPFLFLFALFSPPLFVPATLTFLFSVVVCFGFVFFSLALARASETVLENPGISLVSRKQFLSILEKFVRANVLKGISRLFG